MDCSIFCHSVEISENCNHRKINAFDQIFMLTICQF